MISWLATWTTYGSRLPGDARGSIWERETTGQPTHRTSFEAPISSTHGGIERAARERQTEPTWLLDIRSARVVRHQLDETIAYRKWSLIVGAILENHVHLLIRCTDEVFGETVLKHLKSYSSRALNRELGRRRHWWTRGGSARAKLDEAAIEIAAEYIRNQEGSLVTWGSDRAAHQERLLIASVRRVRGKFQRFSESMKRAGDVSPRTARSSGVGDERGGVWNASRARRETAPRQ